METKSVSPVDTMLVSSVRVGTSTFKLAVQFLDLVLLCSNRMLVCCGVLSKLNTC